jgi:hypothetical protein
MGRPKGWSAQNTADVNWGAFFRTRKPSNNTKQFWRAKKSVCFSSFFDKKDMRAYHTQLIGEPKIICWILFDWANMARCPLSEVLGHLWKLWRGKWLGSRCVYPEISEAF